MDEKQISNALLLPPELIYAIARQIPQKNDLLSFGLVHSFFHDVVIPYYLKFREVIMEVDNIKMWEYLVGDPRRLASVEVLRIGSSYCHGSDGSQPPLPENVVHTERDPLDQIQRALEGMTRLREVIWDENFWFPKSRVEHQADLDECREKFWAAMPRLCKGVDAITLIRHPQSDDGSCWLCGPSLSELHHLQSLRAFTGDLLSYCHRQSDLLVPQARVTHNSISSAFSRLRELSLTDTNLLTLPNMQCPSLMKLSLVNVKFGASDGLLRMLMVCPRIRSLHLDFHGSATLVPDESRGGSAPSLDIVPVLTSFTGHYEDTQILFFNPLPDGRLRRISRLKILGGSAEGLLRSLGSAFEHSPNGIGQDLLGLTIHSNVDRYIYMDDGEIEIGSLLWVTWLRRIVKLCPKLRGLIIEIYGSDTDYQYPEETDDWGPTLSPLKDLAVLKLPTTFWKSEASKASKGGLADVPAHQQAAERCLQWFPQLRLFFPADDLVLVIDPEENKAASPPERGKLLHRGWAMKRYWALYKDVSWDDFDEQIDRLIA
ncbi:hypothetical protein M407DRAFT_31922 [Tulasnella calospora MUT 4182]|uniref:F-box domain-containing protein n=1 Tax=Tulasnella calospora MUT 4182 TaxID=1051891 RepID=A0A0C3KAJ2_9AGAM|nr:hypothetical protein M407DRAFT_31922 [Tulasnella calospora MUT 4182]